jgi:DNA-binding CsgD family transcriptional regulator
MRLLLFFFLPIFTFCQNPVWLDNSMEKLEFRENLFILKDYSNSLTIDKLLKVKQKYFQLSKVGIPNVGWGKKTGWVRLGIRSKQESEYLLHVNSAIFDSLSFYLVNDRKIIESDENLSCLTPIINRPYVHRDFVFPLHLKAGENYTIYLKGKNMLNSIKFPIIIWNPRAFEKSDRQLNFFWGIIIGILILAVIGNFLIAYLLNMRIFYFYGMYILSLILVFMHLDGFLYEYLPAYVLRNGVVDLTQYFSYSVFFWSILFVISFTKLSLSERPFFERILRILAIVFWILLLPSLFSPLWIKEASDAYLQFSGWIARIFFITLLIFLYITVLASVHKNSMSRIYLISVIPPILSYILPQYFNQIFDIWIVQPYAYLFGFLLEIIILSIAMIVRIKEYLFVNIMKGAPLGVQIQKVESAEKRSADDEQEVLSKREIEILTAFAKGFTYQDISDAMFISPHTVRTHLKNIYQKLEISSKAEAVKIAIKRGWL